MFALFCALSLSTLNLIPEPNDVQVSSGEFTIKTSTSISYDDSVAGLVDVVNRFAKIVRVSTGYAFAIKTAQSTNQINFVKSSTTLGDEEYKLTVTEQRIDIVASTPSGFLYGAETLLQLFPPEIFSKATVYSVSWIAPCVTINDSPRFPFRGVLLDVSRHFYDIRTIREFIDSMAHHKLNYLHLHLTDDQGWRIEIQKYPKLTSVGSKSAYRPKPWYREESDGIQYGPFYYTQDEIRELVKFAKARGITIIPEIDLPAHALAALAAYPELSCTGGPFEPKSDMTSSEDVFCLGNDNTLTVLYEVLDEVMSLFDTKYIHVGGDECPTTRWENCPKCQARIKELGLDSAKQLQSWFTQKLLEHIEASGHVLFGWDEIYESGKTAKAAQIMAWHKHVGVAAAEAGHKVVMTPSTFMYFCQYQFTSQDVFEYEQYGYKTLNVAYEYEPTDGMTSTGSQNVLGLEASFWTEWVWGGEEDLYYKLYPRLVAVSEVGWTQKGKKDYNRFLTSLVRSHNKRLDNMKVIHAPVGQTQGLVWTSEDLHEKEYVNKRWNIAGSVTKIGPYKVAFVLTGGSSNLKVQNVKLLIEDKPVAYSLLTGEATFDNNGSAIFSLETNEDCTGKDVVLQASILGSSSTDSEGEVVLYYTANA